MKIEDGVFYTKSHEWVRFEDDGSVVVGLSDYAQNELGDLVFVNLPQVGDEIAAGETLGDVESVKAVSDVFCPVSGTVSEVNEELLDAPQKINEDAYGAWLVKLTGVDASDKSGLMTAEEYRAQF